MSTAPARMDLDEIRHGLRLFWTGDDPLEVRILDAGRPGAVVSGYFDDLEPAVQAAAKWSGKAPGIYCTLNPLKAGVVARAKNRLKEKTPGASNADVEARRWLLVDLDAVRPSGVCATDAQKEETHRRAEAVRAFLCGPELGLWPQCIVVVDSGNGAYVLVCIDEPNDTPTAALLARCLQALQLRFEDEHVSIDQSVADAAQILRIPGTLNAKGDDTAEQPHRLCRIITPRWWEEPSRADDFWCDVLTVMQHEQLEALAAMAPPAPPRPAGGVGLDLEAWIDQHADQLHVTRRARWNGGHKWVLSPCPWDAAHTNGAAYLVQFPSGAVAAGCHHNGCTGRDWSALRELVEPGWRERRADTSAPSVQTSARRLGGPTASPPRAPDDPGVDEAEVTLKPEALHGLAGRVVDAIDPHTEASKVATLAHLLVGVGNLIGPDPHAMVGHDVHPCRLNVALAGASSKGRKGMSRSGVMAILRRADESWSKTRVASGLSTSEGLIYHVRDAREEKQPVKNHGRVVDYESVIVDHGVDDKRLFVEEPEMASVLRRMDREGNALSATIRQAWDSGDLRTLTRGSPLQATNAHISIISHITVEELRLNLTHSDRANGFANRFLFLLTKRSKCLPDPRPLPSAEIGRLAADMGEVLAFARTAGEIPRDAEARELWAAIYSALSAERPGMFGAVTARAEAQVLRLSVLYAVLDCSLTVRPAHLLAGLALWDYADASARVIFGTSVGDPVVDTILAALRTQGPKTRNQIRDLFNRNVDAERITVALAALESQGKARMTKQETGGRPAEHWEAV